MVPLVAAGLISGAASALGSVFGSIFGHKSTKDTNQANMELAKYKYEKDLEMWNRQNEYNTPSAQMQRYAQAGLNPNLVYDQGNNGNASSAPSFDVPEMKAYTDYGDLGFGRAAGNILQSYQLANQEKQIQSQKEVNDATIIEKNANALKIQQERLLTMEKAYGERKRNGFIDEQLETQIREARKRIENLQSEIDTRSKQREVMDSQIGLNESTKAVNEQKVENLKQDIAESLSRIGVNSARINEIAQHIDLMQVLGDKLSAEEREQVWRNLSLPDAQKKKAYNEQMLIYDDLLKWIDLEIKKATGGAKDLEGLATYRYGRWLESHHR